MDLDRFIPNRRLTDLSYGRALLDENRRGTSKPKQSLYVQLLAEALNMNRSRILVFGDKPTPREKTLEEIFEAYSSQSKSKPRGRNIPRSPERILNAAGMVNDFRVNLLDWGTSILAIALRNNLCLWDGASASRLVQVEDSDGPITSVSWAPNGPPHIAVGLANSEVQLWDCSVKRKIATLSGGDRSPVGALAWNPVHHNLLTTGEMDGLILDHDVRISSQAQSRIVQTHSYSGHKHEVCGLKWSPSGRHLASGAYDDLLYIWDVSMASTTRSPWLHKLRDQTSPVRALAWCPFQNNLLASGGGKGDNCIRFWNAQSGACLNSVDTGSPVCALLWSMKERELLSSHGSPKNQLTLWKYPSMVKMAELAGHASRVLYMAQSPDGCTVASAAPDQRLMFWNVFGDPKAPQTKHSPEPFSHVNRIR